MQTVDKDTLHTIAIGSCIMASGGGGPYAVMRDLIDDNYTDIDSVDVVTTTEIAADAWLAGAAVMVPPSVLLVDNDTIGPTYNVFFELEEWCKVNYTDLGFNQFDYFLPLEVGAVNSVSPFLAIALANKQLERSIRIVDADTAGRAIPTLPLIIFGAYEYEDFPAQYPWFPNYMADADKSDDKGGTYVPSGQFRFATADELQTAFGGLMESLMGSKAGFALFPMTGDTLQVYPPISGTLTEAIQVGNIYRITSEGKERADAVAQYFADNGRPSRVVFHGTVCCNEADTGNQDVGCFLVEGSGDDVGWVLKLSYSNENILAYKYEGDVPTADPKCNPTAPPPETNMPYVIGPDSICYVPAQGELVYGNSELAKLVSEGGMLDVYIVAISERSQVIEQDYLMTQWTKLRESLGYTGPYAQPWLEG